MSKAAGDFRTTLRQLLDEASRLGFVAVEINAGRLHRLVGGYPSTNHRMPGCCNVMRGEMKEGDVVVAEPPSGRGASLTIRYRLPIR